MVQSIFFDLRGLNFKNQLRKDNWKISRCLKINHYVSYNTWIKKITIEIRKQFEMNDINMTYQNL